MSEAACSTSAADAVESYTDSGSATTGTDQFRWSDDAPGLWIYNLDTRAFGMATGSCYRLDVYLGNTLVTSDATEWAVLEMTK